MISWKESLERIDRYDRLFRAALKSYLSALASIEKRTYSPGDGLALEFRQHLARLRSRVSADPSPDIIEESAQALDGELGGYNEALEKFVQRERKEILEILGVLAEAASAIEKQNQTYSKRFGSFARQLESVSRLDDLAEIRRRLTAEVSELKISIQAMAEESDASVAEMRRELAAFRHRLESAESLAFTDPLTGLANRRQGEHRLEERINHGREFCVMFLDLDGFKQLNDRYGHYCGDQILRLFGKRLTEQIRAGDVVCRWGGDEFLVILDCTLQDAMQKARHMAEHVGGIYTVGCSGRDLRIPVRASIGVAEYKSGEGADQLFARADSLLYASKAPAITP